MTSDNIQQHVIDWLNHAKSGDMWRWVQVKRKIHSDWIPERLQGEEVSLRALGGYVGVHEHSLGLREGLSTFPVLWCFSLLLKWCCLRFYVWQYKSFKSTDLKLHIWSKAATKREQLKSTGWFGLATHKTTFNPIWFWKQGRWQT